MAASGAHLRNGKQPLSFKVFFFMFCKYEKYNAYTRLERGRAKGWRLPWPPAGGMGWEGWGTWSRGWSWRLLWCVGEAE